MKAVKPAIAAITALIALVAAAQACAGERWTFHVINKSSKTAVEFRTQQGGQWSANWIAQSIEPGDRFNMGFARGAGGCSIRTQIRFADGALFEAPVDYCKVNDIYLFDTGLSWD